MDPVEELRRRGGVARVATLRDAGVSEHALRLSKQSGGIRTVRPGWVALPDADPRVVGAAARGVVLSCVTVAERSGLWVPTASALHVAARPHAARVRVPPQVVVHWSKPVVARPPDALVDDLPNALALIARCQPLETALVIWESALNKGLVHASRLRQLELPSGARRILEMARPFADSGLETIFVHRLRWLDVRMLPQAWVLDRRVDVLIGARLVVQIDGGHHVGAQRTRDISHDAQLTLHGYHVLRFSYEQIVDRWHEVQAVVMEAIAQGKHLW
ncbi:endonuclease domain-containing protein [Microbacterium sp. 179-I 3D3 NHS]|uniref:endonuclease domain-containing protein n=1 Tax=Microbacterium sp. 179-I 3D3 NHS TaxID=3142382 RepID=UPI00399FA86C